MSYFSHLIEGEAAKKREAERAKQNLEAFDRLPYDEARAKVIAEPERYAYDFGDRVPVDSDLGEFYRRASGGLPVHYTEAGDPYYDEPRKIASWILNQRANAGESPNDIMNRLYETNRSEDESFADTLSRLYREHETNRIMEAFFGGKRSVKDGHHKGKF